MAHFIDSLNGELLFAVRKMIVKRTFRRTAFFNNLIQTRAVIPLQLKQLGCRGEYFFTRISITYYVPTLLIDDKFKYSDWSIIVISHGGVKDF